MKKAVMYGAGNIGKGFIGKTFSESGYEVCFIDIAENVINEINLRKEYPVKIISNEYEREDVVKNVRAVNGRYLEDVADEIASADIAATAVGVNVLPAIVKPLCAGLKKRFDNGGGPLNIIICENLIDSHIFLRKLIDEEMGKGYENILNEKLGLVEASIGRMSPVMTDEMREGNPLKVWVEPYSELPVDKDAFKGEIPDIKGLLPFSPFSFYIKRKLFIHNMAHAMYAYMGWRKGYTYIYECAEDSGLAEMVEAAMRESADALNNEYGMPIKELSDHIEDLLFRFKNQALKDTVARVGKDPLRKLGSNDRLAGAALYCSERGVAPGNIIKGLVAGLRYDNPDDSAAVKIQQMIIDEGIGAVIKNVCGIDEGEKIFDSILNEYNAKV